MSLLAPGGEVAASAATDDAGVAAPGSGMRVVLSLPTQTASAVGRRNAINS